MLHSWASAWPQPQTYTTTTLLPLVQRLSDEDVERVARRVVELLKPPRKRKAKP